MDAKIKHTVHSLSEYFSMIEQYGLAQYLSRGESKAYPEIISSALRLYQDCNRVYTRQHINEFYEKIGNELTPLQQKHFLAFAQHHSLPTTLIDFSLSPLVSLFFACYDEYIDAVQENGFVYFIEKSKLLSVKQPDFNNEQSIWADYICQLKKKLEQTVDVYLEEEKERVTALLRQCLISIQYFCNFILDPLYNQEIIDTYHAFLVENMAKTSNPYLFIDQAVQLMIDYYENIETFIEEDGLFKLHFSTNVFWNSSDFAEVFQKVDEDKMHYYAETSKTLGALLDFYTKVCIGLGELSGNGPDFTLPFYCSYKPPNISGRINVQNSVFLYQMNFVERAYDAHKTKYQRIIPDITIEVENKKHILNQLDCVGINLKTIYGDYDNIAKYIKQFE